MEVNEESSEGKTEADEFYGEPEDTELTEESSEDTGVDKEETTEESAEEEAEKDQESDSEEKSGEKSKDESKGEEAKEEDTELKIEDLELGDSKLDEDLQAEILKKANDLGLNKDQAKAFFEAKEEAETGFETRLQEANDKMRNDWLEEAKNDPKIGGENLKENAEFSLRAIKAYGSEGLVDFLTASGLGNNIEVIRTFSKIGREISEAKRIVGDNPSANDNLADHEIMYGKDK